MKSKILIVVFLCLIIVALSAGCNDTETNGGEDNSLVNTHGLLVTVSVSINGGDGKVWATARNDFTLFPATVKVKLQLYTSDRFSTDYLDMPLVCETQIDDLNLGRELTVEAETREEKYWFAIMHYKVDNKEWQVRTAGPVVYSETGERLGFHTSDMGLVKY